jgi:anti-anti-sigma factor
MRQDRVLYATHEGIHVLRFVGNIRYWLAPSLDRFVNRLFQSSSLSGLLIDLTETESIDSTNLGLLARIAIRIRERDQPRVTILSDCAYINELLLAMSLDQVFDITSEAGFDVLEDAHPLPIENADHDVVMRIALDAHRALMRLSEKNRQIFQDVVTLLEGEEEAGAA